MTTNKKRGNVEQGNMERGKVEQGNQETRTLRSPSIKKEQCSITYSNTSLSDQLVVHDVDVDSMF